MGSRKMANSQSYIRKIADKKTEYNEGRLYLEILVPLFVANIDGQNNHQYNIRAFNWFI